jgi:FtsZ-binding cell division protein ZapB
VFILCCIRTTDSILLLQADLTRIKEKVSALMRRKEAAHAELSASLYQLQAQSGELQDTLEELRSSALAN